MLAESTKLNQSIFKRLDLNQLKWYDRQIIFYYSLETMMKSTKLRQSTYKANWIESTRVSEFKFKLRRFIWKTSIRIWTKRPKSI